MYLADYHTHSLCSPDGRDTMADLVRAALAAGLDELCVTDHVDTVDWATGRLRDGFDWTPHVRAFAQAQAVAGRDLTVRLGAELGEATREFARMERILDGAPPLDFLIGSVHTLSGAYGWQDLYSLQERDEAQCRAEIADYLEQVKQLALWGRFSVLGHLTLPLRYMNENRGFHMTFDGFEDQVDDIFRTLIQNGRGIEVNTNRGNEPLPGEKWLKRYRALGGEIVTLGSDAHRNKDVGRCIREGQTLLRDCGFTRFCTFSQQKPVFHAL